MKSLVDDHSESSNLLPLSIAQPALYEVTTTRRYLYISHFLSMWGGRAFEFTVALSLLSLHPSSLLLTSLFGLTDSAAVFLFAPIIGAWVDNTPRLRAVTILYTLQNITVALSAATLVFLLSTPTPPTTGDDDIPSTAGNQGIIFYTAVCIAIISGSLSSVAAMGASLEVERNMPKIISSLSNEDGTCSDTLAIMNARMKAIDLTCLIASPILIGVIMSYSGSVVWACVCLLLWNMVAWFPECWLIKLAIDSCPALAAPKLKPSKETYEQQQQQQPATTNSSSSSSNSIDDFLCSLKIYFLQQPSLPTSLALSLLYLTVMSFGPLMTAYLAWRGMGEGVLSLWRGAGAVSGISATLIFPYLQRRLGLLQTAMVALWFQLFCLLFSVASSSSLFISSSPTSLGNKIHSKSTLLVTGLVLSRFGLWTVDLAANQLIQETVHVDKLGRVNGVQSSLQSFCQMIAYMAGVVVWQPENFPQLMWASCGCVFLAGCLSTFAYHHRGSGM